jgi:hypothetical protein
MADSHVLLRQKRDKKAYRLRCRFKIDSLPRPEWLEKAKFAAAERFVEDMRKQGWEYVGKFGFKMTGPFPATETVILPKRGEQARWHLPSADLLPAIEAGYRIGQTPASDYTQEVPLLGETGCWEYELAGVFAHEQILTEYADPHEERMVR